MAVVKLKQVLDALKELSKKSVVAGWVDANGSAEAAFVDHLLFKATGEKSNTLQVPPSLALIARTLNYGREEGTTINGTHYPKIPPRPFFTVAQELFNQRKKAIIKKYLPKVLKGQISAENFYTLLGTKLQDAITEAMRDSSKYQPLAESTIKARQRRAVPNHSAVPLIDTGTLINSLSFEVRDAE